MSIRAKALTKIKEHGEDFSKFLLVGLSATILTISLLWVFTDILKVHYLISAALATQISIIWNFVLHDNWTFAKRDKAKPVLSRFLNFEAIYITSQVANIAILLLLTEYAKMFYLLSMAIAIGMTFMYNYVMNSKITFKSAQK
ncbi:MAG: GtrA family protein [Candidatus Micrarchaeota archaeon]